MEIKKKNPRSITFVRTVAFIIFCGVSVVLNLNMLILLASTLIERIVFILVSVAIEGAKIYYVTTAPVYKKLGKLFRSKVQYVLYVMCAFISISAAYGYVTTTILSTDVIQDMQSSQKEITYMTTDMNLIDSQIKELTNQKKETRNVYMKDLSIIDSQIDILVKEIGESPPDIPAPEFINVRNDDNEEVAVIQNQAEIDRAKKSYREWEQRIAGKKRELESLKRQKTALIDKNNEYEKDVETKIVQLRNERDTLVSEQNELEKKEVVSLSTGKNKTDMFTAIGNSFGISGHVVMTIILLFIAFSIEIGIVATVPDPNLIMGIIDKRKEEEEERKPILNVADALKNARPPDKKEMRLEEEGEKQLLFLHPVQQASPPPAKKESPFKPLYTNGVKKEKEEEPPPEETEDLGTTAEVVDPDKNVGVVTGDTIPIYETEVIKEEAKKEKPPDGLTKKELSDIKEIVEEITEADKRNIKEAEKEEKIKTILKKPEKITARKIADEKAIKKDIIAFLTRLYENMQRPDDIVDIYKAIDYSKIDPKIAKRFFNRIVNLQGNKGKPLFSFLADRDKWRANYSLTYLINEIVPKIRINYHEDKKQKI